ncbi:MAG: L-threonylcarbamoyladenylate synthase [Desulfomonilia bacterium]|nr:L-threonylcarbamoyladenylate synthase [Desulfomonilia bacterium]
MLITSDVDAIASLLTSTPGTVIAYPTETFYGLGALISDHDALGRIVQIKGRNAAKGMIVLVSDMTMLSTIAEIDEPAGDLLRQFWPGPLSAVLRAKTEVDPLLAPNGSLAARISSHPLAFSLVQKAGPITSTSANISGHPPAQDLDTLRAQGLVLDGILDGGKTPGGKPSTLIDLTIWPPACLRDGQIPFTEIKDFFQRL